MIQARLLTWLKGILVGEDEFGNRYYKERFFFSSNQNPRRWVMYNGYPEASKVPPHWHAWLHYGTDTPPHTNNPLHAWQKPHLPNLTGTRKAYYPHPLKTSQKAYQAWQPEQKG